MTEFIVLTEDDSLPQNSYVGDVQAEPNKWKDIVLDVIGRGGFRARLEEHYVFVDQTGATPSVVAVIVNCLQGHGFRAYSQDISVGTGGGKMYWISDTDSPNHLTVVDTSAVNRPKKQNIKVTVHLGEEDKWEFDRAEGVKEKPPWSGLEWTTLGRAIRAMELIVEEYREATAGRT